MTTYCDIHITSFRIGDVVTLKTGGPRMTVTYAGPVVFDDGDWLICQWFDERGECRQEMFQNETVVLEPRAISAAFTRPRTFAARGRMPA
ncbi:YodC family protein [Burkholderia alba]|uniref:YodC family protein n=1 Tax=Burkholderia alba TaxID=2683677 RepID=UPI002B05B90B|nr:YodC family protein [Burkholderia alba]